MRVEDLTKFEGECPNIVVFGTYMDIRVPLTKKWKKIINERGDKPNTYHNCLISYISEQIALSGFNMKSIGNLLIKGIVFNQNDYYKYNDVGGFPATINDLGYWFNIDKEIFMQPENKNKAFISGTRKTGCDLIILGGTNCDEGSMDWLFGSLGNENFYVCQPASFYKSQQEIQKVNPLYAFKVATAYFREQGKVPVFEDSNCRLIKL